MDNYIDDDYNIINRFDKPYTLEDTMSIHVKNDAKAIFYNLDKQSNIQQSHKDGQQIDTETITVNGVTFKMIHVDGGVFTMGATDEQGDDAYSSEKPTHVVNLSDFSIGETEVTQELWQAIMGYNPSRYNVDDHYPVETVSWDDCQAFLYRLNQLTGKKFRLPTEAEWEYAARGGSNSNGYKYAGGNDANSVSWNSDNSGDITHPVGSKSPNELGIYDMSGNVMEWCQDGYAYYNLTTDTLTNPWGNTNLEFGRVSRGGSFNSTIRNCRVSSRSSNSTDKHSCEYGFRLALSELTGDNISFMKEEQQTLVTQSTAIIPVALSRGNALGSYTARVTLGEPRIDNVSLQNQWVTFANGERIAYVNVIFSDMEVGNTYDCTLNLSETDASTCNPEYGQQILTTHIGVTCDYNWIHLGDGFYSSPEWWEEEFYVPIQHAEGTNVYCMIGLFQSGYDINFTIESDNRVYVSSQPSWYHSTYGNIYLVGDANNTTDGYAGTYNPATKKVTFILYHYVPGVGGFGTFVDTLTMP